MVQNSNTVLVVLTVVMASIILTLAAPAKFTDEKNNQGKVDMRFFPGGFGGYGGYPGGYGGYPGGYGGYPGGYGGYGGFGGYPGGVGGYGGYGGIGRPFGFGNPMGGYGGSPFVFYNNKDGKQPAGNSAAPGGRQ